MFTAVTVEQATPTGGGEYTQPMRIRLVQDESLFILLYVFFTHSLYSLLESLNLFQAQLYLKSSLLQYPTCPVCLTDELFHIPYRKETENSHPLYVNTTLIVYKRSFFLIDFSIK